MTDATNIKVKALSLKQPWAQWVAVGVKTIETRMWPTRHRGPLLICASKTFDNAVPPNHMDVNLHPRVAGLTYPMGVALAIAYVADCRPMVPADEPQALCPWEPGRFAWFISSVVQIHPLAVKGQLGVFDVALDPRYERALATTIRLAEAARTSGRSQFADLTQETAPTRI